MAILNPTDLATLRQRVQACTTDQDVADYQRDGAVCIRNLFTPEEVALLRDGIETNLAHPSPRGMVASRPDDPGRFFEDFCNWQDIPQFKRFIFDTPLAALAQRLMGGRASGILSFGLKSSDADPRAAGARFLDALGLFTRLVNIGDAKSLATHPASTTHRQLDAAEMQKAGVSENMVRLSVGIEHISDLQADLAQALEKV